MEVSNYVLPKMSQADSKDIRPLSILRRADFY